MCVLFWFGFLFVCFWFVVFVVAVVGFVVNVRTSYDYNRDKNGIWITKTTIFPYGIPLDDSLRCHMMPKFVPMW